MDLKVFIAKITQVECRLNLAELQIYDFNPWPYIRLKIFNKYKLIDPDEEQAIVKTFDEQITTIEKIFFFTKSILLYYLNPVKKENIDILYFTRQSEHQDRINNKVFNRYSDSFKYFFSQHYKIKILEMCDQDKIKGNNRDVTYIDFIIKKIRIKCKLLLKRRSFKTPQCDEINQIIENEFGFNVDVEFELLFVQELAAEFSKILASYKPKLVFLTVFYRPEAMAMSLACHRLGIRVVEYQHGAQNDHHVMYTHWENIPKKGYELIPDIFWMWGSIPMKRIMKWATGTTKHRAIVGGNLWMAYIQENKNNHGDMGEYFEKDKINILISLQGDQFFPTFLLESIKNNSSEIIWHFRDHPRLPISDELKNKILKLSNCEIEFSSQAYLYQLFKYINIHITGYSTVAFEAQSFHIPTIFTHINALNGYKDLMNQNGLFYADDLQCFNDLVNTLLSTEVKIEPNYIDSSHVTHNRTLSLLLE